MKNILDLSDKDEFVRDNRWRSKAIVWVLRFNVVISVGSIVMYGLQYLMLAENDGRVTAGQLANNKLRLEIISPFEILSSLAYWVFFIMWFRRAYGNLYRIGVPHLDSPEGLAAGAWFIPFYNFYKPFSIMTEICDNTTYYVQKANPSFGLKKPQKVIGWWWAVYVLSFVTTVFVAVLRPRTLKLSGQLSYMEYSIALKLIEIASAVLLLIVIRRLFPFEEEMKGRQEEIHAGFDVFGNGNSRT